MTPTPHQEATMAKKKTKKASRPSVVHVAGALRSGSGRHPDRKKEASKKACRGRWE